MTDIGGGDHNSVAEVEQFDRLGCQDDIRI
jgi:hypothetical protein